MENKTTDFSALADIKPQHHGRGYSCLTMPELIRVREFYFANRTTYGDIAAAIGVKRNVIERAILRETRANRYAIQAISDAKMREYHAEYVAGRSIRDIAQEIGCPKLGVRTRWQRMGLDTNVHQKAQIQKRAEGIAKTRELLAAGHSIRSVARTLRVHTQTVAQYRLEVQRMVG